MTDRSERVLPKRGRNICPHTADCSLNTLCAIGAIGFAQLPRSPSEDLLRLSTIYTIRHVTSVLQARDMDGLSANETAAICMDAVEAHLILQQIDIGTTIGVGYIGVAISAM